MASWKSPDGFVDGSGTWSDEELAYDGDTGTYAYVPQNLNMWCAWCRFAFSIPIINATKLRIWMSHDPAADPHECDIHLYDGGGGQQNLLQSIILHDQYVEVAGITLSPIAYLEVRWQGGSASTADIYLNEVGLSSPDYPTVISATPDHEHKTVTNDIVLAGTNLTGATDVDFGDDIAVNSYIVDSDIQITANITIGAGAALGARDVIVTTPDGTGTLIGGFTVEAAPTPPVASGQGAYFASRVARAGFF